MTITKSGNIASFYTVGKAPIKHLRVYFSPKQAGTGDPSPSNVREISGWEGISYANLVDKLRSTAGNDTHTELGVTYTFDKSKYPYNVKITGTSSALNNTPILKSTKDSQNNLHYIYGLPILDYNGWICGNGNSYSVVVNDSNTVTGQQLNGYPIVANNTGSQIRIYFKQLKNYTYNLDFYPIISTVAPINVNWSNDIGTVYGGYVDLITGELVQEWLCVDLNNLNWQYNSNWNMPNIKYADDFKNMNIIKATNNQTQYGELVAERYSVENYNALNADLAPGYIIFANTARLFASVASQDDEIQGLACFKLLNPITYQLSPTQLTALIGQNNIWSNADRVEVEYDMMESNDELYRRRNTIIRSYPHIETTSGGIASFSTDLAAPLKECKVYFNPIQKGSGTPSPENVREISGWNNLSVFGTADYIKIIPQNWTEEALDTATLKYIGNNTFQLIGTVENGRAVYVPVQPFTIPKNKKIKFCATINNNSNGSCNIAFREAADAGNAFLFRLGSAFSFNINNRTVINERATSYSAALEIKALAIGIVAENSNYTIQFIPTIENEITTYSSITLPSTFYGGYIDLVNGELVQTHIRVTNVTVSSLVQHPILKYKQWNIASLPAEGIKTTEENKNNYYCNLFQSGLNTEEGYVNLGGNTTGTAICIRPYAAQTDVITNVTDATTWLAQNNFEIVYPLNTPIHHQLTPTQLKTLKGTNNIWSNTNGDISVKYWTH